MRQTRSTSHEAATIIVRGHIQGSGLKYTVRAIALTLKIRGYAKHVNSQTAEIVAEGAKSDIESLVRQVRGVEEPAGVKSVSVSYRKATGEFESFGIVPEDLPAKELVEGFAVLYCERKVRD